MQTSGLMERVEVAILEQVFWTTNWKTVYAVFFAGRFVSTPSMSRS